MTENADADRFVRALADVGFSQYEARCYVGLLGPEPQTGYGVAKATGVPQPKVYEALRKLVARDAARELAGEPARFVAVPPDELFRDLESSFESRLEAARETSKKVAGPGSTSNMEPVGRLERLPQIIAACHASIEAARRRVYLSASAGELEALRAPLEAAGARGVDVVVLSFGRKPFVLEGQQVFHHASTDGALYRHHQAHHVALVADSHETVHAVATDGTEWHGVATTSVPIIAAVKGYIRHDIDMQQVYADFGPQLVEAYGPGLQALESYRQDPTDRTAAKKATTRRRRTG